MVCQGALLNSLHAVACCSLDNCPSRTVPACTPNEITMLAQAGVDLCSPIRRSHSTPALFRPIGLSPRREVFRE